MPVMASTVVPHPRFSTALPRSCGAIRRATSIETDLLHIQAEILHERADAAEQGVKTPNRRRPIHSIGHSAP
jgi:hypothetical protein